MESADFSIASRRSIQSSVQRPVPAVLGIAASDSFLDFEKLRFALRYLRRRTQCMVVLGVSSPDVMSSQTAAQLVSSGEVDRIVYSGDQEHVVQDVLDEVAVVAKTSAILLDAEDLANKLVDVLRAVLTALWTIPPFPLRNRLPIHFWPAEALPRNGAARLEAEKFAWSKSISIGRAIFVTAEGLRRIGGEGRLRTAKIRYSGLSLRSSDVIWRLGGIAEHEPLDSACGPSESTIPSYFQSGDGVGVLFDIRPATPYMAKAGLYLDIPRQVLSVRRVGGFKAASNAIGKCKNVVLMSNFEKAAYVGASLYSLVMQTVPDLALEFWDDCSSDGSLDLLVKSARLLNLTDDFLRVRRGKVNRGTYWIRNRLLSAYIDDNVRFFVNDSDDFSSAQRIFVQTSLCDGTADAAIQICDSVRVDSEYRQMVVSSEVERYGTATLTFSASTIRRFGFFEVLKRNADTEFIERIKRFGDKSAFRWDRVPVLYQPFYGGNLTADTHVTERGKSEVTMNSPVRTLHRDLFKKKHSNLRSALLPAFYMFPLSNIGSEYASLGTGFLVENFESRHYLGFCVSDASADIAKKWLSAGHLVFDDVDESTRLVRYLDDSLVIRGTVQDAVQAACNVWCLGKVFLVGHGPLSSIAGHSPDSFSNAPDGFLGVLKAWLSGYFANLDFPGYEAGEEIGWFTGEPKFMTSGVVRD